MRILGNQSGVSKYKVLIILVVLGIGFREGIKYLDVQLDYQRMKDTIQAKAAAAQILKDDEILVDLEARARELDLPLKRENFSLVRGEDNRKMTIRTGWSEEVTYLWGLCGEDCTQVYTFNIVADETSASK